MPISAPMTPATLSIIRDMARVQEAPAIATAIGWDMDRLRRVAKAHAIELMGCDPTAGLMAHEPSQAAAAKVAPPIDPREMIVDEVMALLSPQQKEIVRFLLARLDYNFVSGTRIANGIGIPDGGLSLSNVIQAINAKFDRASTHWKIEGQKGSGGGYRLVTDGDGS